LLAVSLAAQSRVEGRLLDPSQAPVPGARILLKSAGAGQTAITGTTGEFRFEGLAPGDYELAVTVSGFEPLLRAIRISNRPLPSLVLRLRLATRKEELTVAESGLRLSTQAGENADVISVERTMLDKLPMLDNDPVNALARFLDPGMPGGSGASLIVDGMEARKVGVTPSAIQEIRINNNPYTVEYPRWSRRRIEVITKASADRYHGTLNFLFRDHHLNARDAFAIERPLEQRRIFEGSLFGPVGKRRNTSFLLSGAREEEDLVAVVFAQGPKGPVHENAPTPQLNTVASLRISHQLGQQHAMFWQYNFQDRWQNNLGVGGTTLAEAGTQSRFREDEFIFNHRGILTTHLLSQFRILLGRYWTPVHSNLNAPKIVVTDAFTGGGAQADRLSTEVHTSITWLLTQTAGRHTLKYGINIPDWSRRGLVDKTNQTGTFSYASLGEFSANRPFAAVLQRGDAKMIFIEKNAGGFLQDELQMRPNLSVAAGIRYDWQNYFGDGNNIAPRLSLAWSPDKKRRQVIRAGAGFFFERSGPQPIWDILRFNGAHLRRYVLSGGQVPELAGGLDRLPTSVHRLEPGVALPNIMQFSATYERQIARRTTLAVNYVGVRGVEQLRSRDANAPLPPAFDARPDASLNVLRQIEAAGRTAGNSLEVTLRGDLARRVSGTVQYVFGKILSNSGGVNWFPADSFAPNGEWGRADADRRHMFNFLGSASLHRWANFGFSAVLQTGPPYNITTGRDDNRDGMALDRPPGGTRNTGLGPGMALLDVRWYRDFKLHPVQKDKSPSLTFLVDAFNIFNHVNPQNYIGARTSPFFGRAVGAYPPRRLQLGVKYQF
ncbi:MAG: TonB-dependent receptor, partial [Acidobacteria bacterium]|nr:TonB-dependent receptor [Acidobacteriota bacterium]